MIKSLALVLAVPVTFRGCFRPGYCFVALRSAVEFLVSLDGATVGMSQLDFCR